VEVEVTLTLIPNSFSSSVAGMWQFLSVFHGIITELVGGVAELI